MASQDIPDVRCDEVYPRLAGGRGRLLAPAGAVPSVRGGVMLGSLQKALDSADAASKAAALSTTTGRTGRCPFQ